MREKYKKAFKVLRLDANADKAAIRLAYKKRVQRLHPDRNDENATPERKQEFQDVLDAYKLINEALKSGDLKSETATESRSSPQQKSATEQQSARPLNATPSMRQRFAADSFYRTKKHTSAVHFVAGVVILTVVLVVVFTVIGAQQKQLSPTPQWDPTYHEDRVRGITGDDQLRKQSLTRALTE